MISVEAKERRLDGLQPTSLSVEANIGAHTRLLYPRDGSALSAEQSCCLRGSCTARGHQGPHSNIALCHDPVAYARCKASPFGLANENSELAGAGCRLKEFAARQCWIKIGRLYRITFLVLHSRSDSEVSIILDSEAQWYDPRLCFEARPHHLAPSKRLAMLGPINKALPNRCRVKIERIHGGCVGSRWESFWGLHGLSSISKKLMHPASHAIDLVRNKQILSGPVYKLGEARNSEDSRWDQPDQCIYPAFQVNSRSANAHFLRSGEPLDCLGRTRRVLSSWIWQTRTIGRTLVKATLKTAFRTRNGRLVLAIFQVYSYTKGSGQPQGGLSFPSR